MNGHLQLVRSSVKGQGRHRTRVCSSNRVRNFPQRCHFADDYARLGLRLEGAFILHSRWLRARLVPHDCCVCVCASGDGFMPVVGVQVRTALHPLPAFCWPDCDRP